MNVRAFVRMDCEIYGEDGSVDARVFDLAFEVETLKEAQRDDVIGAEGGV